MGYVIAAVKQHNRFEKMLAVNNSLIAHSTKRENRDFAVALAHIQCILLFSESYRLRIGI